MNIEDEFHQVLLDNYRKSGEQTGYWGNYSLREVRKKGGLATARRMLLPKKPGGIHTGLQSLIDAGRTDLSFEAAVLDQRFRPLFTPVELAEAERRLALLPARRSVLPELNHADELNEEDQFIEGAVRRVTINYYERDSKARAACLKKHGFRCAVCEMTFTARYGPIGRNFIHIHHKKPLAVRRSEYTLKPSIDLAPVCPNCHAMLHTQNPPLGIDELREHLRRHGRI